MAFESTNAILGIRGMEQQKKNDRWSKLMDIASVLQNTAGLGADIWKTISGRKYGTDERIAGEQFATNERIASQEFEMQKSNSDLEQNKAWLDYQNSHPGKPSDQLYAEWLQTPEGQAWQADQEAKRRSGEAFDHSLKMKEILASNGGGISQEGWTTYDNAISRAISTFYEQDETGAYGLRKGVTQEQVGEFLNGFLDPAFASAGDIDGLKKAFDLWLQNPDFPGENAMTAKDDTNELVTRLMEEFAKLAANNPIPKESPPPRPGVSSGSSDSGVGGSFGADLLDQSNAERTLEKGLKWFTESASVDPTDKALAKKAYDSSAKMGFLSDKDFQTFQTLLKTLQTKYGGMKATK